MVSAKPRPMSLGSRYSRNINDKVVLKGPVITLASGYWTKNRPTACGRSICLTTVNVVGDKANMVSSQDPMSTFRWNVFIRPPLCTSGGGWMKTEILISYAPPQGVQNRSQSPPLVTVNRIAILPMLTDCKTYRHCFHFYSRWHNFYSQWRNFYSRWWSLHRYTQDSACKFHHRL